MTSWRQKGIISCMSCRVGSSCHLFDCAIWLIDYRLYLFLIGEVMRQIVSPFNVSIAAQAEQTLICQSNLTISEHFTTHRTRSTSLPVVFCPSSGGRDYQRSRINVISFCECNLTSIPTPPFLLYCVCGRSPHCVHRCACSQELPPEETPPTQVQP